MISATSIPSGHEDLDHHFRKGVLQGVSLSLSAAEMHNVRADESWYYGYSSCMKLWKEERERKDERKRRAKAASRKRAEE
ncbi:hypothetical protein Tco_0957239 [Tanacetum coccineum]